MTKNDFKKSRVFDDFDCENPFVKKEKWRNGNQISQSLTSAIAQKYLCIWLVPIHKSEQRSAEHKINKAHAVMCFKKHKTY